MIFSFSVAMRLYHSNKIPSNKVKTVRKMKQIESGMTSMVKQLILTIIYEILKKIHKMIIFANSRLWSRIKTVLALRPHSATYGIITHLFFPWVLNLPPWTIKTPASQYRILICTLYQFWQVDSIDGKVQYLWGDR